MTNQAANYTLKVKNQNLINSFRTKEQINEIINFEGAKKLVNDWNEETYFILQKEDVYLLKVGDDLTKISKCSAERVLDHLRVKSLSFEELRKEYQERNA